MRAPGFSFILEPTNRRDGKVSINLDPLVWQITAIVGIALILITFYRINKED